VIALPTPHSEPRHERAAQAIAELIAQLWVAMASRAMSQGMKPAQWNALRYLAQANESARHVGAFAEFNRTTPSSASQTMTALVNRGLVVKKKGGGDSRQRMLALTAEGRRFLKEDPLAELANTIATLSEDQLFTMAEIMEVLIRASFAPPAAVKPAPGAPR
jgi:DNA-binding MarR family transcriptional regulator